MSLKILYQSKEKSRTQNEYKNKITYYGTENEVDAYIATLEIGVTQNDGTLTAWRKSNTGGDIYQVETEYTTSFDTGFFSNVSQTVVGQKSATLSVRNIQMPLEHLDNYRANWNYYLIGRAEDQDAVIDTPEWWETAENIQIPIADRKDYRWVKSPGEIPSDPDADGLYWFIVEQPLKPGVQYYDWACFVITESQRFKSATAAGNAINKSINTITSPTNTFGLSGGGYNFKLDQVSVQWDGKSWIANSVYTRSGDNLGWDEDIYGQ